MMIKVFDDIIDKDLQDNLENLLFDFECPWYYHTSTITPIDMENVIKKFGFTEKLIKNIIDSHMFVHTIVKDEDIKCKIVGPLVAKMLLQFSKKTNIPVNNIYRAKANLQLRDTTFSDEKHNAVHKDNDGPHWVVIYYVNDCDGDTLMFDNNFEIVKRISPKKGRILFFNGDILHASQGPRKSLNRCILNINLEVGSELKNGS